ncbi:MAG: hypothetical protein V4684_04750 [Pseudomonadota bacterium]
MSANPLTEKDHDNMDAFIDAVLQDFKEGVITKEQARVAIGHVMAALAIGNLSGALGWLAEGRKFIHRVEQL